MQERCHVYSKRELLHVIVKIRKREISRLCFVIHTVYDM